MSDHFISITPRHKQALALLIEQKKKDFLGGIGVGALREDDDAMTLEQIVVPLSVRGLIEDLTKTEMGTAGKYFARITPLGEYCYAKGYMLKEPHVGSIAEMNKYANESAAQQEDQPIGLA
jgi:hypothetical protein